MTAAAVVAFAVGLVIGHWLNGREWEKTCKAIADGWEAAYMRQHERHMATLREKHEEHMATIREHYDALDAEARAAHGKDRPS